MSRSSTFVLCPAARRLTLRAPTLYSRTNAICLTRRCRSASRASAVPLLTSPTSARSATLG
eukprot:4713436-Pleurochrysis_carterae.AAC.1